MQVLIESLQIRKLLSSVKQRWNCRIASTRVSIPPDSCFRLSDVSLSFEPSAQDLHDSFF